MVSEACTAGHFCPPGTASATSFPCPPGTYTDEVNRIYELQCSLCPAGSACLEGTGGVQKPPIPCAPGHFCPIGTEYADQFECLPGTWTDKTFLTAASECTICERGNYCVGGQSSISGICSPGYYCPEKSYTADQIPCPSGFYSPTEGLFSASQCLECPEGSFCLSASTEPTPCYAGSYSPYKMTESEGPGTAFPECITCPAGHSCAEGSILPQSCGIGFHSDEGSHECSICSKGYYCASETTTTTEMLTNGGYWSDVADSAGKCFNGSFCDSGTSRIPTLELDACPAGFYCPISTTYPIPCPPGTINPMAGKGGPDDCLPTPAGYYSLHNATEVAGECQPGFYCPSQSTSSTEYRTYDVS